MNVPLVICGVFVFAGCSSPSSLYCDENTPCEGPERPYCDLAGEFPASEGIGRTCIPDPFGADGGIVDAAATVDADPNAPDAFERDPGTIVLLSQLTGSNLKSGHGFGASVAIDSTRVVVGAPNGDTCGNAYVFSRTGNDYLEDYYFNSSPCGSNPSQFGTDMTVIGDQLLVSASSQEQGSTAYAGGVFVFDRSGATWSYNTLLGAAAPMPFGVWGERHAGTQSLLVARGSSTLDIFEKVGGVWAQRSPVALAEPGDAVAAGAGFFAVGLRSGGGMPHTAVAVYEGAGNSWSKATLTAPSDLEADDDFGAALLAVGERLYIGAPGKGIGGIVYAYEKAGGVWSEVFTVQPAVPSAGERFGSSISVGGDLLVVGAPGYSSDRGAVYVLEDLGTELHQHDRLTALDGNSGHGYGHDVATSGTLIAVVASGYQRGYVYEWIAP